MKGWLLVDGWMASYCPEWFHKQLRSLWLKSSFISYDLIFILIIQAGHNFARDLCKIVTRYKHYFSCKSNTYFYKIGIMMYLWNGSLVHDDGSLWEPFPMCHQMETYSVLLAICAGNSPVPSEFPTQRPVTQSFDVFFDLRPNKRLCKQWWGWWFETPSCPFWRRRNAHLRLSVQEASQMMLYCLCRIDDFFACIDIQYLVQSQNSAS